MSKITTGMIAALVVGLCAATEALAGDELVIRDERGLRVGTIEPSPIYPEKLIVRDEQGRRLGTIEPDAINKDLLVIRDERGRRVGTVER